MAVHIEGPGTLISGLSNHSIRRFALKFYLTQSYHDIRELPNITNSQLLVQNNILQRFIQTCLYHIQNSRLERALSLSRRSVYSIRTNGRGQCLHESTIGQRSSQVWLSIKGIQVFVRSFESRFKWLCGDTRRARCASGASRRGTSIGVAIRNFNRESVARMPVNAIVNFTLNSPESFLLSYDHSDHTLIDYILTSRSIQKVLFLPIRYKWRRPRDYFYRRMAHARYVLRRPSCL